MQRAFKRKKLCCSKNYPILLKTILLFFNSSFTFLTAIIYIDIDIDIDCLAVLLSLVPCPKSVPLLWIVTEHQSCGCASKMGFQTTFVASLELHMVFRC